MSDISQIGVPSVALTAEEIAYLLRELEHADKFEQDSQGDEPWFRWPLVAGNLKAKIEQALAGGWNVVLRCDQLPLPSPPQEATALRLDKLRPDKPPAPLPDSRPARKCRSQRPRPKP